MQKHICDEQNGLHDTLHGDDCLPELVLPKKKYPPLGKYGRMRKTYPMQHYKGVVLPDAAGWVALAAPAGSERVCTVKQ